jgi:hypothetical protein
MDYDYYAKKFSEELIAGLDERKPETLQVLVDLTKDTQQAIKELVKTAATTQELVKSGAENVGVIGNTAITGSAVVTMGMSGLGFASTTSPAAKGFYALSFTFSGGAVGCGAKAVLERQCQFSQVAILSEGVGAAFLYLGNYAHAAALKIENKPVPTRYRRPINFGLYNGRNNVAFVMPYKASAVIERIPFETIGRSIGFVISIYCYGKILIKSYRYGQQLIVKYEKKKFLKSIKFITTLIYLRPALCKRRRVYRFAVCG